MKNTQIRLYKYYNFLFWHYVVLEMPTGEIGKMCGVGPQIISNYLKKHNIPRRSNRESSILAWKNEELRKKHSKILKEVWDDPIMREKQSKRMRGRELTEEWKQKIGNGNRGKIRTEEYKQRISVANTKEEWNELGYTGKHRRIGRILKNDGISKPEFCPICGKKPKSKKKMELMNIDHKYKENPLDYYYTCEQCHKVKYHSLSGLEKRAKKIQLIPNLISNLQQLKTRPEREQLLKKVIINNK